MDEDYAEAVLSLVEQIPRGRVLAYGDVASMLGRGGPRQVARVMAVHGSAVPWWRVLRADGTPAPEVRAEQLPRLRRERVPERDGRVVMSAARWQPRADGAGEHLPSPLHAGRKGVRGR